MEDRIDFALEPGVLIFAIAFFVLINLLLAAILYPYLSGSEEASDDRTDEADREDASSSEIVRLDEDAMTQDEDELEERVEEYLDDMQWEHK